jgi:5'-nucleotidase
LLTILHTNDLHGALTEAGAERLRALRQEHSDSTLLLDSGDCIRAGNLAVPLRQEKAWELLGEAGCDAGTLGNRESHPLEAAFRAKLAGARHPLVCANLRDRRGAPVVPDFVILNAAGLRIGVVGAMVPMVTARMASHLVSAFLWVPPIPAAKRVAQELRGQVDCLIGLTHIGHRQDLELAEACPLFDLILGGHTHTVLREPVRVGETFVCQDGSHARFVGRYRWSGRGRLESAELLPLKDVPA